jgi:esterase/lipase superfamily enzyme
VERVVAGLCPARAARAAVARALLVTGALLLGGCATERVLMPTPNVYASGLEQPFADTLDGELRTAQVEILYATDRSPETRPDGRLDYGIGRSFSLAIGRATVAIGGDASWEQLAEDASTGVRERTLFLEIPSVIEVERTPEWPLPYTIVDGLPVVDANVQQELQKVADEMKEHLQKRLARLQRKEILLYVHGVANTFDEALYTTAELWHYLGREFVPVAYTWPAGHSGPLRGYTYDRESSEFTVFHFKRFLDWLSRQPEVEGIHIISHSRGTDVVTTGIRELLIEGRARGEPLRERYKLRNVVMAAPDINLSIMLMRTASEFFGAGIERLTMYTSPNDKAIGIAEFLFGGGLRLGQADFENTRKVLRGRTPTERAEDAGGLMTLVEYTGQHGGAFGHNYFRTNPAVSSDLVLTVRYGRNPGAENGRPLIHDKGLFWRITDDYLLDAQSN